MPISDLVDAPWWMRHVPTVVYFNSNDFAFVFNANGDIRAIHLSVDLADTDPLPYSIDKMIQLVTDLQLITKLERTYH